MHRNTKMATCCYCGTRAALVLRDDLHVLACASCGAPLRNLKSLPVGKNTDSVRDRSPSPAAGSAGRRSKRRGNKLKKGGKKTRKSTIHHWFAEVIDEFEDLFD